MLSVYKQIAHAANAAAPVLIIGDSGTGKELVARAIHAHGRRAGRPFVPINCGALTESVLESELFGHTRGSFTGAIADTKGIFEQATGGTVFLDEIGETSAALQVKLLRVLQEGEVRPVGGSRLVKVDVRVVAATNVDLEREVAAQRFRQDLFYRLSVIVIRVPALRDRREDIPLLIQTFMQNACARAGRRIELSPAAISALTAYRWPGNVRELENTIERGVVLARGDRIALEDLLIEVEPEEVSKEEAPGSAESGDLQSFLDQAAAERIRAVLAEVNGVRLEAARRLGVDRTTLYRLMRKYRI